MTMLTDPGGAVVGVWRPGEHRRMAYFAVDDTDQAARRAAELGAEVAVAPFDTAYGRMAVLRDPSGAAVSVIKPTQPASG